MPEVLAETHHHQEKFFPTSRDHKIPRGKPRGLVLAWDGRTCRLPTTPSGDLKRPFYGSHLLFSFCQDRGAAQSWSSVKTRPSAGPWLTYHDTFLASASGAQCATGDRDPELLQKANTLLRSQPGPSIWVVLLTPPEGAQRGRPQDTGSSLRHTSGRMFVLQLLELRGLLTWTLLHITPHHITSQRTDGVPHEPGLLPLLSIGSELGKKSLTSRGGSRGTATYGQRFTCR